MLINSVLEDDCNDARMPDEDQQHVTNVDDSETLQQVTLLESVIAPAQQHQWADVFEDESYSQESIPDHATTTNVEVTASRQLQHDFLPASAESQRHVGFASDAVISDFERLRTTHATAGYRDGITTGKAATLQTGFDEGFALGGEIGRAAGFLVGCFRGIACALSGEEEVVLLYRQAVDELGLESVFGREYLGEDGLWRYDVLNGEQEEDVTFAHVAWAHPLIVKWNDKLHGLAASRGVDLDALKKRMDAAEDENEPSITKS